MSDWCRRGGIWCGGDHIFGHWGCLFSADFTLCVGRCNAEQLRVAQ